MKRSLQLQIIRDKMKVASQNEETFWATLDNHRLKLTLINRNNREENNQYTAQGDFLCVVKGKVIGPAQVFYKDGLKAITENNIYYIRYKNLWLEVLEKQIRN